MHIRTWWFQEYIWHNNCIKKIMVCYDYVIHWYMQMENMRPNNEINTIDQRIKTTNIRGDTYGHGTEKTFHHFYAAWRLGGLAAEQHLAYICPGCSTLLKSECRTRLRVSKAPLCCLPLLWFPGERSGAAAGQARQASQRFFGNCSKNKRLPVQLPWRSLIILISVGGVSSYQVKPFKHG